jgi:CRP-like cAMP-binding protein
LERSGYTVRAASQGKEGVRLVKEVMPDLVLCDIMMPELDGYGVLHILSRDPKTSVIPFIFLTAKGEVSDIRKGMNLGADDYIIKPFEDTELLDAIENRFKKIQQLELVKDAGVKEFVSAASQVSSLEVIVDEIQPRAYAAKDVLYREGDYPNYVYWLKSGKIRVSTINEDGKELIHDWYSDGDYFGFKAVLEESDYKETATVIEGAEVVLIPRSTFIEILDGNRDVSMRFIKMLANDLAEKEEQLISLAYDTVRRRVVLALCRLTEKYRTMEGAQFSMVIPRAELASMVGTATESVIRALTSLKEEGVVEVNGGEIKVLDEKGLEAIMF